MRPRLSYTANQGVCAAVEHVLYARCCATRITCSLLWNTYCGCLNFRISPIIILPVHDSMSDTHAVDIKAVFLEVVRSLVRLVPPHHKATLKMKVGNYVQKKPGAAPHVTPMHRGATCLSRIVLINATWLIWPLTFDRFCAAAQVLLRPMQRVQLHWTGRPANAGYWGAQKGLR